MPRTKASKVSAGVFASVIRDFMATKQWEGYSNSTKTNWGRVLRYAEDPREGLGGLLTDEITPADVQDYLDSLDEWPGTQYITLRALRCLDAWAGLRDKLPRQVTFKCKVLESKGGRVPWEPHEVTLAQKYASPQMARAVTLAYYTGQRCCDLAEMMHSDVEHDGAITEVHVIQKKTKRELWIPFPDELKAAYATWERRLPDNILLRPEGVPYTANAISKAWAKDRDNNPDLEPLKKRNLCMHGLRGGCCVRLSRKGLNDHQIGDWVGMSVKMVERYTRLSSQRANARAALAQLNKNGG